MRSNIIQMLLNASSGKGGSSPGQPSSEWTIVHFLLGKGTGHHNRVSKICFRTKSEDISKKYYYCKAGKSVKNTSNAEGFYGFADISPYIAADSEGLIVTQTEADKIDLAEKDSNGRPMMLAFVNGKTDMSNDNLLFKNVFSTRAIRNNMEWVWYTVELEPNNSILPDGSTKTIEYDLCVAINVRASELDSVTIQSQAPIYYAIQDQSSTIKELVNNWETNSCPKTDFSKDRLIKVLDSEYFYSETNNFGLTIQ